MVELKFRVALNLFLLISLICVLLVAAQAGGTTSNANYTSYLPIVKSPTNLIFADDFSDSSSGWPTGDDSLIGRNYQGEEYEMLIHQPRWWAGAKAPISMQLNHYSVEADMRRLQGSTSDYGLVFDRLDWDNFYFFAIDPGSQWYLVAKVQSGTPKIIVPQTDTTVIKPGNEVNHLKVERKGATLAVHVNGQHLATTTNSGFGGLFGVGLYMEADADAPASVRYDNFEVWRLETGMSQPALTRLSLVDSDSAGGGSCEATSNWCDDE